MIRRYAFLFLWLFSVSLILISGKQPNPYLVHVRKIPLPHAYSWVNLLSIDNCRDTYFVLDP